MCVSPMCSLCESLCGYIGEIEIDQLLRVVFECRLSACRFINDGVRVGGGAGSVHRSCCEIELLV